MKQATIIGIPGQVHLARPSSRFPVVIADAGDGAWIVDRAGDGPPRLGERFAYRGQDWRITGYREHARAYVAEPVQH